MILKELQADPAVFRRSLRIDDDGRSVTFGDAMEGWQADDFRALDPGWQRVAGQDVEPTCKRAWLERPRGHSKTTDIAVMVTWVVFASRRKLSGIVAAADKDQARLIRDAVDTLVRLNPWLTKILDVQQWLVRNVHTGSEVQILSSDVASSYGLTPDFVVCDELTHWRKPDLWESLFSSAAKRRSCLLVVICNAGFGDSWQWELREAARSREDWYFHRLDGPQASWVTHRVLDEQRALLPEIAFRRLWENEWTEGEGDAFDPDDITAALTLDGPILRPEPGWEYVAGLDIGLRHDSTAFAIVGKHVGHVVRKPAKREPIRSSAIRAMIDLEMIDGIPQPPDDVTYHRGSGRLRLAVLKLWTPTKSKTVDLPSVERTVAKLARRFNLRIGFDPWQAVQMSQNLQRLGVPVSEVGFQPGNLQSMARCTLDVFQDRQIDLFEHVELQADLKAVRVVEKSYGFRLESARKSGRGTRHADTVTALGIALHIARGVRSGRAAFAQRPMVLYP